MISGILSAAPWQLSNLSWSVDHLPLSSVSFCGERFAESVVPFMSEDAMYLYCFVFSHVAINFLDICAENNETFADSVALCFVICVVCCIIAQKGAHYELVSPQDTAVHNIQHMSRVKWAAGFFLLKGHGKVPCFQCFNPPKTQPLFQCFYKQA